MMVLAMWAAIVLFSIAVSVVALRSFGIWCWAAETRALDEQLEAARCAIAPASYNAARELDGLPAPVQRFFRAVLKDGQPMVAAATIEHTGTFNLRAEGADQWKKFTSRQRSVMRRPGFVWDGRVAVLPGVAVHVHDAYVAGEGILHPAVMGLVSLAEMRDSSPQPGGVAQGEFLRWFAETAWYPTALLPSQGVRWSAVDEHTAKATLRDGTMDSTLLFRFDPQTGFIASVRASARAATMGDKVVLMPWEGHWADYADHDGMQVPMRGEVSWITSTGPRPYWRGSIAKLHYAYAK